MVQNSNIQKVKKELTPNIPENPPKPLCVLIVLDGFGIRGEEFGNAVKKARTPVLDTLWSNCPRSLLSTSGNDVGLPPGYTGNSEVGHLNLGSGQVVYQSLTRIDDSIRTGKFGEIPVLKESMKKSKENGSKMHLMGLLSPGGVHSHIEHLFELMKVCKKHKVDPFIHVILDGVDTGEKDGILYLNMLKKKIEELGIGRIASISGRWYAMDRNQRWERTQKAYDSMLGIGERKGSDPMVLLQESYKNDENDELFEPATITNDKGESIGPIEDDDVVIFYNFREDRAIQITKAFVLDPWEGTDRKKILKNLHFVKMSGYAENLPLKVLFEPHRVNTCLSTVISSAGYSQLHIAETEKGAHVTYFFNGGREDPHDREEFFIIPSPKTKNYAETPAMSAEIIRDEVVYRLGINKYNFILVNFANPDMIGHTGELEEAVEGIEVTDKCVGDIVKATIEKGGTFIITSDHGNPDIMIDPVTGEIDKAHTLNPVPLIIGKDLKEFPSNGKASDKIGEGENIIEQGILADVGVTTLAMLGLKPTEDMVGMNLYDSISS